MSVILKALRSQQEEGAAPLPAGDDPGASSFQVDTTSPGPVQGGGSGSNKRTVILLIGLLLAIVLLVVLRLTGEEEPAPAPRAPEAVVPAELPAPAPAVTSPAVPTPDAPAADAASDLQMARSQFKAGQYDDSIKSFQRAIEKNPNTAAIHNDFGLVLLKKELFTSAENHFAKALELDDDCAECYNNLGYLKTLLNQPVEAEIYLQKAIALRPDYPDAYFNLGVLYEKNGDVGQAVAAYRNFLKRLPKSETDMAAKIKDRIQELSGE